MNTKKPLPSWLPLVVGGLLVVQFLGLSVWQISRGMEKRETQQLYEDSASFSEWQSGEAVRSFQHLRATGRYDSRHQIVLDNIIMNHRRGHYVITPLELGADVPVLLVNRGWIETNAFDSTSLEVTEETLQVRGRAGSLPKAGYKMGEAFEPSATWPKHAVYPSLDDVAAELGRDVHPFVLLMTPEEENGFFRHWVPTEFGPSKHFGYAFQWFAMAAVLFGLLLWNYKRRKFV
ncbi:MAG: SURF1 family protein [Pseudomonadota bacterium]